MPQLFRKQQSNDEDEWTPPSEPISQDDWKPPNDPIAPKESGLKKVFKWATSPLVKAETIDPRSLKESPTEARIKGFIGGVLEPLSTPLNIGLTAAGAGEELPAISQVAKGVRRLLSVPVTVEGLHGVYKGLKDRSLSETLTGGLEAAGGVLGLRKGETPSVKQTQSQDIPSVRQTLHTTPQQDRIAIALTKEGTPRTAKNISDETGIPQASVRRTMSELKNKQLKDKPFGPELEEQSDTSIKDESGRVVADEQPPIKQRPPGPWDQNISPEDKDRVASQIQALTGKKAEETKPTAEFAYIDPNNNQPMYNVKGGDYDRSTVSADRLKEQNIDIPPTPADAQLMSGEELRARALAQRKQVLEEPKITLYRGESESAIQGQDAGRWYSDDPSTALFYSKRGGDAGRIYKIELPKSEAEKYYQPDSPEKGYLLPQDLADKARGNQIGSEEEIKTPEHPILEGEEQLQAGFGAAKRSKKYPKSQGPNGPVLDKLFQATLDAIEKTTRQELINRAERAKRFAAFSDVTATGSKGAAIRLSKLRGEFEKVNPGEALNLKPEETDQLFNAITKARISEPEKARSYTALFKILNGNETPQRNELALLDQVFGNNFADRITELHGGLGAVKLQVSKIANTMKSMQNAFSLAAPLRHGIGLAYRKEFYPALGDMFKFFGNKEFYDASMKAIRERPNFELGRDSGLFLSKPGSIMNSEEEFLHSYAEKITAPSSRAYSGFLNKLRSDVFDNMIKQAEGLGYKIADENGPTSNAKAIAKFINTATGRGDLGALNKYTNELNTIFWSPRMIASRVQVFTNPKLYTELPKEMRMEGLKSLLGIAALGTTIDTLSSYGGAKVKTGLASMLSTDFGKSRFNQKDVIDPWGGFQQYIVAAARFLATAPGTSSMFSREQKRVLPQSVQTPLDVIGQFLKNKESPAASFIHDLLTAKKFEKPKTEDLFAFGSYTNEYGRKTTVPTEIIKRFTPIFFQDLNDLVQKEPDFSKNIGLDTALGIGSLAGMTQNYPEPSAKRLRFRKLQ